MRKRLCAKTSLFVGIVTLFKHATALASCSRHLEVVVPRNPRRSHGRGGSLALCCSGVAWSIGSQFDVRPDSRRRSRL